MQQDFSTYQSTSQNTGALYVRPTNEYSQQKKQVISWAEVEELPYMYNWDIAFRAIDSTNANGGQYVWDLYSAGYPDSITPLQPIFARRFAAFCSAFVRYCKYKQPGVTLTIAAINIAALSGNKAIAEMNTETKAALVQACEQAIAFMKEEDPTICFLSNHSESTIIPFVNNQHEVELALAKAS